MEEKWKKGGPGKREVELYLIPRKENKTFYHIIMREISKT
jgi:hypothetical protein